MTENQEEPTDRPDGSTNITEEQAARTEQLSDGTGNDAPEGDDKQTDTVSGGDADD